MYKGGRGMPWLRRAPDYQGEISLEVFLDARDQVLSNTQKLFTTERADEIDVEFEGVSG